MSVIGDLVQAVVDTALKEVLRKAVGTTGKRRRRRTSPTKRKTAASTLRQIEKILRPAAARQVSRKRTVRARSKTKRRRSG